MQWLEQMEILALEEVEQAREV
eukprot:SAG11_NODE_29140_length_314_cov_0.720930_1_plen_21_part_01